jgi:mono/diheme cytochrome c family protein
MIKKYLGRLTISLVFSSVIFTTCKASPEQGKALYIQHGCWGCHGYEGQGGIAGPKLSPDPKPIDFYHGFVRYSSGAMPPYSEKILPKKDLIVIYEFLQSIPKGPDYMTIQILNN